MICKFKDRRYWRHHWTQWGDFESVVREPTGCSRSIMLQERRCTTCNYRDVRKVVVRD